MPSPAPYGVPGGWRPASPPSPCSSRSPRKPETIRAGAIRVIDGDTIDAAGDRFRLVGFDTPETYGPKCDYELTLGRAATARLQDLLDGVQIADLVVLPGRDRYDRGHRPACSSPSGTSAIS